MNVTDPIHRVSVVSTGQVQLDRPGPHRGGAPDRPSAQGQRLRQKLSPQ
jgi:hypothetical protein